MNWKSLALPVSLVLVILVIGTLVEAHFTDRWVKMESEQLDRFAEAIDRVPQVMGSWEGTDDPISDEEFRATNCKNYVSRHYVNQATGDATLAAPGGGSIYTALFDLAEQATLWDDPYSLVAVGPEELGE